MLNNTDGKGFTNEDVDNFLATAEASIELSMKGQEFKAKLSGNMIEFGTLLYLASEQNDSFRDILVATASYYTNKK